MLVHEADLNKGGLPLAAVREECPGELRGFIFERERSFHTYVDARLIISRGMKRMKWPPPLHLRARTPFRSVTISCLQACYQVAASGAVPGGVAPPHRPGASRRLLRPPGQLHFISSPPAQLSFISYRSNQSTSMLPPPFRFADRLSHRLHIVFSVADPRDLALSPLAQEKITERPLAAAAGRGSRQKLFEPDPHGDGIEPDPHGVKPGPGRRGSVDTVSSPCA